MKPFLCLLFLLTALLAQSQCSQNLFVLSPSVGKAAGSSLSVNLEAGFSPSLSKSYVSAKSSLWSETKTVFYTNGKGEEKSFEKSRATAFVGLNCGYTPLAFEGQPRKWVFGAAAGALLQEGEKGRPATLLSAAYTVRMAAGNLANGLGCLKLETTCLASSLGLKPGISAGVFLLL